MNSDRSAREIIGIMDSAATRVGRSEAWEVRLLLDGSRYSVYRRYFTVEGLSYSILQ